MELPIKDQTPTEAQSPGQAALERGLASRARTMEVVAKANESLGHTATGREVNADIHGTLLTDRDLKEIQANGHQES